MDVEKKYVIRQRHAHRGYGYTSEEPNSDIGRAMYCGADCVKKNGIPQQWASSNQKWAHIMYGTRYFEIERDGGFWAAMRAIRKP
jgi:hypothetical protein